MSLFFINILGGQSQRNSNGNKTIENGCIIDTMETMPDHIHLFIKAPPTLAIAKIVQTLKGYSSYILRKEFNQRSDMHWKLARQLCRDYDVMVFETLDLDKMERKYKKSINDFGFSAFLSILEYVSRQSGKTVMYADKYYPSSQLCSECGYKNPLLKDVGIRHWTCPCCGTAHDRDINAARNLCKVGASTFPLCGTI